jgi:hypothetical protein
MAFNGRPQGGAAVDEVMQIPARGKGGRAGGGDFGGWVEGKIMDALHDHEFAKCEKVCAVFFSEFGDGEPDILSAEWSGAEDGGSETVRAEVFLREYGERLEGGEGGVVGDVDAETAGESVGFLIAGLPVDEGGDEHDPVNGLGFSEIDLDPGRGGGRRL